MSKDQDLRFDAIADTLQTIIEKIDENGKATQSQIDEIKTGIYTLEERVAKLEQKPKRASCENVVDKNEIVKIVREVMHERGGVLQRKEYGVVLDKNRVYARCGQCGYSRRQVLKGLKEAEVLITNNDGHSLRVVWDGKNCKAFRAIVISLKD